MRRTAGVVAVGTTCVRNRTPVVAVDADGSLAAS
jgi:hypothetical protein